MPKPEKISILFGRNHIDNYKGNNFNSLGKFLKIKIRQIEETKGSAFIDRKKLGFIKIRVNQYNEENNTDFFVE